MVTDQREVRETNRTRTAVVLAMAGACAIGSAGCAATPQPIYRWGVYEDVVYETYAKGGADPGTQILVLSEDIVRTQAAGKRVPPGAHAHLGYLYAATGQPDLAAQQFQLEKDLFPESATFVDGMLERMNKP
jgi:hypothetical protein